MFLKDNPFYLLNVSMTDDRSTIIAAAEKCSASLGWSVSQNAQEALLTSDKRLKAEMGWFPQTRSDRIQYIRKCIQTHSEIQTENANALAMLNALLYNFAIKDIRSGSSDISGRILDIAYAYSRLNAEDIIDKINYARDVAKLPVVTKKDVDWELYCIRISAQAMIKEKITQLDHASGSELISKLMEAGRNDPKYKDNAFLSKLLDDCAGFSGETNKAHAQVIKTISDEEKRLAAKADNKSLNTQDKKDIGSEYEKFKIEMEYARQVMNVLLNDPANVNLEGLIGLISKVENRITVSNADLATKTSMRTDLYTAVRRYVLTLYSGNIDIPDRIALLKKISMIICDDSVRKLINTDINTLLILQSTRAQRNTSTGTESTGNYQRYGDQTQFSQKQTETKPKRKRGVIVFLCLIVLGIIFLPKVISNPGRSNSSSGRNTPTPTANASVSTGSFSARPKNTAAPQATRKPTPTPKPTPRPTPTPKPMYVYNGMMLISTSYECVCPFTIIADSMTDYYIYLEYTPKSIRSYESRKLKSYSKAPYETDIAFYLKAGQSVKIQVPIGCYKLYYATGQNFYGTKEVFGKHTNYYSSDELLDFYATTPDRNGNYNYMGHTITLQATYNGNFDTDPISESQFPKR